MIRKIQVIPYSRNDEISILMLKTIPVRGGFWQCVTGKVEPGEEDIDAAYREFEEETGLGRSQVRNVQLDVYSFTFTKKGKEFTETVFGFEIDRSAVINLTSNVYPEHTEYAWLTPEEAMQKAGYESQVSSISRLLMSLTNE